MRLATLYLNRGMRAGGFAGLAAVVCSAALAAQVREEPREPDMVVEGTQGPILEPTAPYGFQTFEFPPAPPRESVEAYERQEALVDVEWRKRTLPGADFAPAGPNPGTESSPGGAAPGDMLFKIIGTLSPTTGASPVNEPSVGIGGGRLLATGNWWAAKHFRGGKDDTKWQYIDPYADFPAFCCDQDVVMDPGRNIFIWYRQGIRDTSGTNEVKITIGNRFLKTFWTYTFTPASLSSNFATDWFDYPHLALTNDYLFITTNMFNGGTFQRMALLRLDLDDLAAAVGVSWWWWTYNGQGWTWTPTASGCTEEMYLGDHWDQDTLTLWKQNEGHTSLLGWLIDIAAWTGTGRGSAFCPDPSGSNPCARLDQRITSGWVHDEGDEHEVSPEYHQTDCKVVTFFWTVQEGNGFPFPYVEAATVRPADLAYVNRPLIWSSGRAFIYGAGAGNARGHSGIAVTYVGGDLSDPANRIYPQFLVGVDDDYTGNPPGWPLWIIGSSDSSPGNVWGDYARVRSSHPSDVGWGATGHVMIGGVATPKYTLFHRERDSTSLTKYYRK